MSSKLKRVVVFLKCMISLLLARNFGSTYVKLGFDLGWIHLQHLRTAKNATTCLFASHAGYAYGVSDKSTARSSLRSYFIGYFDADNSDYFSQMRQLPAQILAKGLHFPVRSQVQIYLR